MEFAVLTLDPVTKAPRAKIYKPAEIDALLSAEGLTKQDEDTEMTAWFVEFDMYFQIFPMHVFYKAFLKQFGTKGFNIF